MSDLVLDVRRLQVKFNQVKFNSSEKSVSAVDEISCQLQRGQTLGIVGESGSGKSVTSLALMGLVPYPGKITGGEIWFTPQGSTPVNLLTLNPEERRSYRGGSIAMIFQEPMSSLNPVFTCGFQLTEAIQLHQQVSLPQARRLAMAGLQEVKLLPPDEQLRQDYLIQWQQEHPGIPIPREIEVEQQINLQKQAMLDRYPHQLSGGQLQRMMIAMAISCNPDLLIADEPTTALDVTVQATILALLKELKDSRQMSLIFITHDLGIIAEIADTVAVMYQGKIVEAGAAEQIFRHPQHPYTKGLLACRPRLTSTQQYLPTVSDFMEVVTTSRGTEIREKSINAIPELIPTSNSLSPISMVTEPDQNAEPLLVVENLRVGFPIQGIWGAKKRMFWAVDRVSFQVFTGETLGLVGESGCGKSTLARTLMQLITPTTGNIFFEGKNILPRPGGFFSKPKGDHLQQLRRQMQIVFQNPYSSLDPRQKIGAAIMEPLIIHRVGNKQSQHDRTLYLLEKVGLDTTAIDRYPHEFSGGQRQRICIARALALNPKFIICDESVSALDVSVQAQVLNLLKSLQREFNLTYIFISHDLSVVKFMSDRIMVMNRGAIEEIDIAENIYRHPASAYTRQLIAAIPQPALLS